MHHTMLVSCVNRATAARQSGKVVRRVPCPEIDRADIAWLRQRERLDTRARYARPEGSVMQEPTIPADRGDEAADAFATALRRAQAEFLEMPGLQLTEAQAARLWSFDSALCTAVLTTLVESRFLVRRRNTLFARA